MPIKAMIGSLGELLAAAPAKKKTLSPRAWYAAFNEEGQLKLDKVLKRIRRGGVDPSTQAEVWEFLVGCYGLTSTAQERDAIRSSRRCSLMDRRHLLPECEWGAACYRTNPKHLSEYWHPPGTDRFQSQEATASSQLPAPSVQGPIESKDLVLLLLIGPPGSGKSTVCEKIVQTAARPWTRVCQDVISNGKRGTKQQCLKLAGTALSSGCCVLIDRCNIDVEQRKEFLLLAKDRGIEAHALVINLPLSVCIKRASQRTEHEGGLQGSGVGGVVTRVSRSLILPTLKEGFVRITYCRTDTELENAVALYSQLDQSGRLPSGVFGASVQEGKGSLRSLLAKDPNTKSSGIQHINSSSQNVQGPINPPRFGGDRRTDASVLGTMAELDKDDDTDGSKSLAFPSISTADFQFDHEMAADIIVEMVVEFHRNPNHAGMRLVFVDLSTNSDMLCRVSKKAAEAGVSSPQLVIHAGDITKMLSSGGPKCKFIANATNWRLKPGGGGVNAAIFEAAGHELEIATKAVAKTLLPGDAVAVPLPATSPLRKSEGVTHIIHVLGPNMNPLRPSSLSGDYVQGCRILRNAYSKLFTAFSSVALKEKTPSNQLHKPLVDQVGGDRAGAEGQSSLETKKPLKAAPKNAFAVLMQSAKRKGSCEMDLQQKRERPIGNGDMKTDETSKKESAKTNVDTDMADSNGLALQHPGEEKPSESVETPFKKAADDKRAAKWGAWAQELRSIALHPEKHSPAALEVTQEAVVIADKYPKGKKHLLVIARRDGLDSIEDVSSEHLPVLRHMHALGEAWARRYIDENPSLVFRLGYHWVPSMRQLHMHVISQDLESPSLKNKKHWNSFTSGFFRDSQDVLAEVEEEGRVIPCGPDAEDKFLRMELRCHRCRSAQPNMPRLKSHLLACKAPLDSPFLISSRIRLAYPS